MRIFGFLCLTSLLAVNSFAPVHAEGNGKVVNSSNIARFLKAGGFTPTREGNNVCWITATEQNWKMPTRVSPSVDESRLWIIINLGEWNGADEGALKTLLGRDIGAFKYQHGLKVPNMITLASSIDNRDMTTSYFRSELRRLCRTVIDEARYWKPLTKAEVKLAGSFEGEWETQFGTLTIRREGRRFFGHYESESSNGDIRGRLSEDGRTLTGKWIEANKEGGFSFTLNSDGKNFNGKWWMADTPETKKGWWGKLTSGKKDAGKSPDEEDW